MSTTITRQIVRIDEELCNGCGVCVSPCAEGAIVIVDGKAKVVREELCDGAGFCLGVCPTGALTLETRDAVPFDHDAAEPHHRREAGDLHRAALLQLRRLRRRPPAAAGAHQGRQHLGLHALSAGTHPRLVAPRPRRASHASRDAAVTDVSATDAAATIDA